MVNLARVGRTVELLALDSEEILSNTVCVCNTSLGDVINKFRGELGLEELPFTEGPLLAETLRVPFTYCWSPSLVPKPKDWGQHIGKCCVQDIYMEK